MILINEEVTSRVSCLQKEEKLHSRHILSLRRHLLVNSNMFFAVLQKRNHVVQVDIQRDKWIVDVMTDLREVWEENHRIQRENRVVQVIFNRCKWIHRALIFSVISLSGNMCVASTFLTWELVEVRRICLVDNGNHGYYFLAGHWYHQAVWIEVKRPGSVLFDLRSGR